MKRSCRYSGSVGKISSGSSACGEVACARYALLLTKDELGESLLAMLSIRQPFNRIMRYFILT